MSITSIALFSPEPTVAPVRRFPSHRERVRSDLARYSRSIDLFSLVREHGSPLLVLDPSRIRRQVRRLAQQLPGAAVHFATKTLPHPAALRAVADAGGSFEVASRSEIDQLRSLGVDLSSAIHTHPIRSRLDIDHALAAGVRRFVVDNPGELAKLADLPADADILVRLSFPNAEAGCDLSTKFGATIPQAVPLVEAAVRLGIRVAGFSFHVGSQTTAAAPFVEAIAATTRLMTCLEIRLGLHFDVLDIGGGLPVEYDSPVARLPRLASGIRHAIRSSGRHDALVLEPGRFVTGSAMTLVTRVVGSSERVDGTWHYLDDGLYGSYSNILTEGVHPLVFAASELRGDAPRRREPVTLAGPTCDSIDVIARGLELPPLHEGDLLVSPMMGAYTTATATGFNGLPPTRVMVLDR